MSAPKAFIDSNVLLYLLSADTVKADVAESVVAGGGVISVQVLNEVTNVIRRKLDMSWDETIEVLGLVRSLCPVEPLTVETHEHGLRIAQRYGLAVYDAMIVAAALLAGCETLYSEDMHNGLAIDRRLRIRNPFVTV